MTALKRRKVGKTKLEVTETEISDEQEAWFLEVAISALAPLHVPVLADLPVGHQPDNHTLPLGAWAALDTAAASLTLSA